MKCLLKRLGQIQCAKVPECLSLNRGFFNTLTWGVIVPYGRYLDFTGIGQNGRLYWSQ